ncbi:alpha-amylase family glycosyl hydrolase [Caldalkalibacillus thermarum]
MSRIEAMHVPLLLRGLIFILCILLSGILASGCSPSSAVYSPEKLPETTELVDHWPHGVFYEIFVMSFYDSDGDGIGDIQGMTAKLDYLQELGVEGVWLMPISPSPSYHKYDAKSME